MRDRSDQLTPAQRRVLDDVDENGVHVVRVPASEDWPEHCYSVGLWHSFEQPEVVVFGLPSDIANELIEAIADEAAEGATFATNDRHDGLLHAYSVRFEAVPKAMVADRLPIAAWANQGEEFPVLQIVWPDKQGHWPWDSGVRDGFREMQPVLGRMEAT